MIIAFACPCTQKVVTPFSKDRFHIREVKDKRVLMRVDFNVSRPRKNTMQRTMCLIFLDRTHFEQMRRIVFDGWHPSFQYLLVRPMDKEGNITNTQRIVWSLGKIFGTVEGRARTKKVIHLWGASISLLSCVDCSFFPLDTCSLWHVDYCCC